MSSGGWETRASPWLLYWMTAGWWTLQHTGTDDLIHNPRYKRTTISIILLPLLFCLTLCLKVNALWLVNSCSIYIRVLAAGNNAVKPYVYEIADVYVLVLQSNLKQYTDSYAFVLYFEWEAALLRHVKLPMGICHVWCRAGYHGT